MCFVNVYNDHHFCVVIIECHTFCLSETETSLDVNVAYGGQLLQEQLSYLKLTHKTNVCYFYRVVHSMLIHSNHR